MKKYLFIDDSIENLIIKKNTSHAFLYQRLINEYKRYTTIDLPKIHPPKSTTFMGIAMMNLSLLYLLSNDKNHLIEAKRWIFCVTNYSTWGNAHLVNTDLSASWILFGLSLSYNWLKDYLTSEERKIISDKIFLQGSIMYKYKKDTEGHGWSTNYWQNHNWINMTGLITAGYVLEDNYQECKFWIKESKENFEIVFDNLATDGSNYEGVVYWRYGGMWLFVFAHLIKQMEGINYFKKSAYLKNTFYYRLYQAAPNLKEIINFGDCHDTYSGHSTAVYYKIADEYNNGHAMYLANKVQNEFFDSEVKNSHIKPGILFEAGFEYLWYNEKIKEKDFTDLPTYKYFEDLGLIVLRSSFEKDALHFSFKCSSPGGKTQWKKGWELYNKKAYNSMSLSHHHPDNNSFIINKNNQFLVVDDGYNRNILADDHNTITVDGKYCLIHNVNDVYMSSCKKMLSKLDSFNPLYFKGEITFFKTIEKAFLFSGETAKVYDYNLKLYKNERTICYSSNNYILIIDDLQSDKVHNYTFNLHTSIEGNFRNNTIHYHFNNTVMSITPIYPQNTIILSEKRHIKAIMTTQEPNNFIEKTMYNLKISTRDKVKDQLFVNLITFDNDKTTYQLSKDNNSFVITIKGENFFDKLIINSNALTYSTTSNKKETIIRKKIEVNHGIH